VFDEICAILVGSRAFVARVLGLKFILYTRRTRCPKWPKLPHPFLLEVRCLKNMVITPQKTVNGAAAIQSFGFMPPLDICSAALGFQGHCTPHSDPKVFWGGEVRAERRVV